jgi:predicted  nucleic acid-binding Zn-ribbon protein
MALTDRKITGTTPIKDFPQKYDGLIDDLVAEINRLNNLISSKDTEVQNLKAQVIALQNNLRAEFGAWFDQKMDEFEDKFVKKTNN